MNKKVLIMAAGTGGHVFPALSIARQLKSQSIIVEWLGTRNGMEKMLLTETDIPLHYISVKGLRGSRLGRKLFSPLMLLVAFFQSLIILLRVRPDCVLGMGGFVCGPAGVAVKILRKPLLIHEQNAVAGLTNRLLSICANKVFEAFPGTFTKKKTVIFTGNPVRREILEVKKKQEQCSELEIRLLVLGGSQGSLAINNVIPGLITNWSRPENLLVFHQTGQISLKETIKRYEDLNIDLDSKCRVAPFFEDMAAAYEWADIVVCRSGATTVSEISAVGLPSILIPYPYHSDNQQNLNAKWLVKEKAATIILQSEFSVKKLFEVLVEIISDQEKLKTMAANAKGASIRDASERIAQHCIQACYD